MLRRVTPALGFALAALACFGLGDLIYKRGAAAGAAAHRFIMVQSWFYGPTVTLYGLATGTLALERALVWGVAAGLFVYTGFYNFARSLEHGSVSINAPIFRLSFTITAALAVLLLGEPLGAAKLAGLGLALGAVWLLLGGAGAGAHASRASLARVLLATATVGVGNLIYKVGLADGATPAALLVVQAGVVIMLSTGVARLRDGAIRPTRVTLRHASAAAVVLAFAFIFMLEALARGEASVMVPIAQMGFVVTAAIGFVVLREPFSARKGLGIACALGALASLAAA